MVEIGLVYVKGVLPRFEDFVNLPTCTILEDGLVNGKPASEILDLIVSVLDPSVEYPMSTIKTAKAINAPVLLITDSKLHGLVRLLILRSRSAHKQISKYIFA
jgi:hypothetical protein